MTILELLTVLAVMTILVSLLLPAVQEGREAARRTQCENRVRQLALAVTMHESSQRYYPSGGWGYAWVGDPTCRVGDRVPGGWIHATLPYIEQRSVWGLTRTKRGRNEALSSPLPMLVCPTRRDGSIKPYTLTDTPLRNATAPAFAAKTDYAICAGSKAHPTPPGPASGDEFHDFDWPDPKEFNGISFVRSRISDPEVLDGMSETLMLAEKSLAQMHYSTGESLGDDQSVLIGDDADIRRWTQFRPRLDSHIDDIESFGSAHHVGFAAAMLDGSVRRIAYDIDIDVYQSLGNRADGVR